jgi:histidine triad (HIT) family protein
MSDDLCPFCEIVAGRAPATIVREWPRALAITPLNPVVHGHVLVLPKIHVRDFADDPVMTGETTEYAARLAGDLGLEAVNLITSKGRAATQSVFHLHMHLVPRSVNDGLALPWHSGKSNRGDR